MKIIVFFSVVLFITVLIFENFANGIDLTGDDKISVFDYVHDHIGEEFLGSIVFRQQKYYENGQLKQVDSFALKKLKGTPAKYPDQPIVFSKKNFTDFLEFLKGSDFDVHFKRVTPVLGLPHLNSEKYLYEEDPINHVETGSYRAIYDPKFTATSYSLVNTIGIRKVQFQGLNFKGKQLIKNVTITSNPSERFEYSHPSMVTELHKITPSQSNTISAIFQLADSLFEEELEVASMTANTLDFIYPNYDWSVLISQASSAFSSGKDRETLKYLSLQCENRRYVVYGLPKF